MYTIGETVCCSTRDGVYEVVATKELPKNISDIYRIPIAEYDYALKRVDGSVSNRLQPFVFAFEVMLNRI